MNISEWKNQKKAEYNERKTLYFISMIPNLFLSYLLGGSQSHNPGNEFTPSH